MKINREKTWQDINPRYNLTKILDSLANGAVVVNNEMNAIFINKYLSQDFKKLYGNRKCSEIFKEKIFTE